jgi:membrane protein DedA with SNARE-associated domain
VTVAHGRLNQLHRDTRRARCGPSRHWWLMEHFLETWGYLAVFVLSFISAMGLPVGAEVAIIYGGVLASGQIANEPHHLNVVVVIVVATVAEILGSLAGYLIGYFGGRPLVDRVGKYVLLTHKDLDRAEAWFARRGEPVALFGRFIPLLRSFVSFAAGLGEMAITKFLIFTAIGCAIWCTALTLFGYSLGSSYNHVLKAFSYAGYVAAVLAVIAVAIVFWHRIRVVRAER